MLIWSRKGRVAAGLVATTLFTLFFFLPLAVILMSSLSQQWNGLLPSGFTFGHFVNAFRGAAWSAARAPARLLAAARRWRWRGACGMMA